MHDADASPADAETVHDEVRAIGSLAQAVVDQGIPAVLGMRYSVFVVTAAQYIGELYRALAKGSGFGEAASQGRKHLQLNPDRWVGLQPRPLQDWFVPVVYEAARIKLLKPEASARDGSGDDGLANASGFDSAPELDPVRSCCVTCRMVASSGGTKRC